jgi:hypothetical protein
MQVYLYKIVTLDNTEEYVEEHSASIVRLFYTFNWVLLKKKS